MLLSHLEYLAAVKRHGSMNRAAAELYTSQPTITNAIRSLEKEIGGTLVKRSSSGVTFTPLGEQVAADAAVMLGMLSRWKEMAAGGGNELRIAFPLSTGHPPMIDLILDYKRHNPDFSFKLIPSYHRGVRVLEANDPEPCRMGFFPHTPDELERTKPQAAALGLRIARISRGRFDVCFSASNPLAKKERIVFSDIVGQKVVLKGAEGFPYISVLNDAKCDCSMTMGDHDNIMIALLNDPSCISFRPKRSLLLDTYAASGLILHRPVEDLPMEMNQYMLFPTASRLSAPERRFIDFLSTHAKMFEIEV